jgi:hypothetical protein
MEVNMSQNGIPLRDGDDSDEGSGMVGFWFIAAAENCSDQDRSREAGVGLVRICCTSLYRRGRANTARLNFLHVPSRVMLGNEASRC